jgi:WhiB family redox-sensing transcriptional regulator
MIELLTLPAWRDQAVCRDLEPALVGELFFPLRGSAIPPRAFELCDQCPVAQECLDFALTERIQHGIWGGTTGRERRRIRSARRAATPTTAVHQQAQ